MSPAPQVQSGLSTVQTGDAVGGEISGGIGCFETATVTVCFGSNSEPAAGVDEMTVPFASVDNCLTILTS